MPNKKFKHYNVVSGIHCMDRSIVQVYDGLFFLSLGIIKSPYSGVWLWLELPVVLNGRTGMLIREIHDC